MSGPPRPPSQSGAAPVQQSGRSCPPDDQEQCVWLEFWSGLLLFIESLALSAYALAKALDVPLPRLNETVCEKRSIPPEVAVLLSAYFATCDRYLINLQGQFDLEMAKDRVGKQAVRINPHFKGADGSLQRVLGPCFTVVSSISWSAGGYRNCRGCEPAESSVTEAVRASLKLMCGTQRLCTDDQVQQLRGDLALSRHPSLLTQL